MTIDICLCKTLPEDWLTQWSAATYSEEHLTPETPGSLQNNLLISAVAISDGIPVGFGGLIAARTNQGHGLVIDGKPVVELGGAYIKPAFRGTGIWKLLAFKRIQFAVQNKLKVVCITGNPIVQSGLKEIGSMPMDHVRDRQMLEALCLKCKTEDECGYCPLQPQTSWLVV